MKISKKKETKITKALEKTTQTTEAVRDAVIKEAAEVLEEEAKKQAKDAVAQKLENIDVDATIKNTIQATANIAIDTAAEKFDTEALLKGEEPVEHAGFFKRIFNKITGLFKKNK